MEKIYDGRTLPLINPTVARGMNVVRPKKIKNEVHGNYEAMSHPISHLINLSEDIRGILTCIN